MAQSHLIKQAWFFGWLTKLVWALLAVVLVAELTLLAVRSQDPATDLLWTASFRLPLLAYLWGIGAAIRALGMVARGEGLAATLPNLLRHTGSALIVGAGVQIAGAPLLLRGLADGSGSFVHFDPSAIALGVIGLLLSLVSSLLREGQQAKSELNEIV